MVALDRKLVFLVFFLFFLLFLFFVVFITGRSSTSYSEAFLENHDPVFSGQRLGFSFFIANFEGKNSEYIYKVFFDGKKISEKKVLVENNAKKEISETVFFGETFSGKKKVLVEIYAQDRKLPFTIFFWVSS